MIAWILSKKRYSVMNKLLIFSSVILIISCVRLCTSDGIPVAVQSHRQLEVESVNVDSDSETYSPHVFEIEPSSSPLRLVFSSESSPLALDMEKIFGVSPDVRISPDMKQDRKGTVESDDDSGDSIREEAVPVRDYNEDEYVVVEQYQRYVPVKILDNSPRVENDEVVVLKPNKVKTQKKLKKVKVPVIKLETKETTSKPVLAKQVATKPTAKTTTKPTTKLTTKMTARPTPAETITESSTTEVKTTVKFGARIARHSDKVLKKEEKSAKIKAKSDKKKRA